MRAIEHFDKFEKVLIFHLQVIEDPDIDEVFMSFFSDADPVDEKFSTSENDTHVIKRLTDASGELKLVDVTVPDDKVCWHTGAGYPATAYGSGSFHYSSHHEIIPPYVGINGVWAVRLMTIQMG